MSKLLLIDDEADVQYSFRRIFDSPEIELTTASSGEEGLQLIPKLKPDLVLMDIRMGGITGIQALEEIRKTDQATKVIMVTGTKPDENDSLNLCRDLGVLDYIHKPLRLDELERVVLSALQKA